MSLINKISNFIKKEAVAITLVGCLGGFGGGYIGNLYAGREFDSIEEESRPGQEILGTYWGGAIYNPEDFYITYQDGNHIKYRLKPLKRFPWVAFGVIIGAGVGMGVGGREKLKKKF